MKTLFSFIAAAFIVAACSNNNDTTNNIQSVLGTWRVAEMLVDPGDGSGTFETVDGDRTFTFEANGTVTSNANICYMSHMADIPSTGTYSHTEQTITSQCEASYVLNYEIENGKLIITYPCVEPCKAKYERLE
jgi:hypothetical protein